MLPDRLAKPVLWGWTELIPNALRLQPGRLVQGPDHVALYNAGGATTGIAKALKDRGRDQKTVLVAHEATAGNNALLLDGTLDAAIDQNPRVEIREALNILTHAARGTDYRTVPPRRQIVFRENLPAE